LSPHNNFIRELLIKIYNTQLLNHEKSIAHQNKLKTYFKGQVFIVSGLPRSGTSMLMQMLVAGGLDPFSDKARKPDLSNPEGYFEHELIKSLHHNSKWMSLADHKLIKVVAPIIKHLPLNFTYKIVFVERSLEEVVKSQIKMLDRSGKGALNMENLYDSLDKILKQTKSWLHDRTNIELLFIKHSDILKDPLHASNTLNAFFDYKLDAKKMAACVKHKLYREKVVNSL